MAPTTSQLSAAGGSRSQSPSDLPQPKKFFIFGQGISFSMSPVIHGAVFKYHSLPYTYEILQTQTVDELSHLIGSPDFGGASVTMPHKLTIGKFCSSISPHAKIIGAINTLVVVPPNQGSSQRSVKGDNTDWSGLISCLKSKGSYVLEHATTGLVIGAGGASRAALYALYQLGIKNILLVNRTRLRAERIAADFSSLFQITVISTLAQVSGAQKPDIIIGTIPADVLSAEYFPKSLFGKESGVCIDMAYKPRETPLLKAAEKYEGWAIVRGVEVLLEQAFDQSQLWLGLPAPKELMASELEKADAERAAEVETNQRL
ncbi:quinate 5-dehydrogenase, protein [Bisporella sp. PMI_857]|nr:quinate 5-dehydrogenase, protein [Bisporella sp. PMI_857]